jgi:hypothetical protein
MRKEIEGVVYDTQNAVIDKKFTYRPQGDPSRYEETLYVTDDGRHFIYCNGGAASRYPDEKIVPIRREDVRRWVLAR